MVATSEKNTGLDALKDWQRDAGVGVRELMKYADKHPDDSWNRNTLRIFPQLATELIEQAEPEAQPTLETLLCTGKVNRYPHDLPVNGRRTGGWHHNWPDSGSWMGAAEAACRRRVGLARLYLDNFEMAGFFAAQTVLGFHATGGINLESVLSQGLLSRSEQEAKGTVSYTGERFDWTPGLKGTVSVAEWDTAFKQSLKRYGEELGCLTVESARATLDWLGDRDDRPLVGSRNRLQAFIGWADSDQPTTFQQECLVKPFPLLVGIGRNALRHTRIVPIRSDIDGEFGLVDQVSPSEVPLLLVPNEHVEQVKGVVEAADSDDGIRVASITRFANTLGRFS